MFRIFVEYRIQDKNRQEYLMFIHRIKAEHSQLEVLEGTDQPNLFVEIWSGISYNMCINMKEERTISLNSKWAQMNNWVTKGQQGIHIWHFTMIT